MSSHNQQLAALLTAIANLLSTKGENQYRIRAYRRAAESVLQLNEDVSVVAQRGELRTIPGIGKDLSGKVEEFLSSGSIRTYEELKSPLPPEVNGVGRFTWIFGTVSPRSLFQTEDHHAR